jgi:hypothetical protein
MMSVLSLLQKLWNPGPYYLVLRDGSVPVGAYYSVREARSDAAELNEEAMFLSQPRRYQVIHRKLFLQR